MSKSIDLYTLLGQVEPEPEEPGDVEPEPVPEPGQSENKKDEWYQQGLEYADKRLFFEISRSIFLVTIDQELWYANTKKGKMFKTYYVLKKDVRLAWSFHC